MAKGEVATIVARTESYSAVTKPTYYVGVLRLLKVAVCVL